MVSKGLRWCGPCKAKKKGSAVVVDRYHCRGVWLVVASDLATPLRYLISISAVGWKWMKCGRTSRVRLKKRKSFGTVLGRDFDER